MNPVRGHAGSSLRHRHGGASIAASAALVAALSLGPLSRPARATHHPTHHSTPPPAEALHLLRETLQALRLSLGDALLRSRQPVDDLVAGALLDANALDGRITGLRQDTIAARDAFAVLVGSVPQAGRAVELTTEFLAFLDGSEGPIQGSRQLGSTLRQARLCLQRDSLEALEACLRSSVSPGLLTLPRRGRAMMDSTLATLDGDPEVRAFRSHPVFAARFDPIRAGVSGSLAVLESILLAQYLGARGNDEADRLRRASGGLAAQTQAIYDLLVHADAHRFTHGMRIMHEILRAKRELQAAESAFRRTLTNPHPARPTEAEDVEVGLGGVFSLLRAHAAFLAANDAILEALGLARPSR